jgi:orotate phosphoribosyltransferase
VTRDDVLRLLPMREGHFLLESGHHDERWIDLELLFLRPERVGPLVRELAARVAAHRVEAICGPLVEGAFVALGIAAELDLSFSYAEPIARPERGGLFPVDYRIPRAQRPLLAGKRVAIANDVINAGSAVRGALLALRASGARPVAIATLLVLGDAPAALAASEGVALETLASLPNRIWDPQSCPLCTSGAPLTRG